MKDLEKTMKEIQTEREKMLIQLCLEKAWVAVHHAIDDGTSILKAIDDLEKEMLEEYEQD